MDMSRAHLLVSGIVQGVFFRSTTRRQAVRLGLTGWVKNKMDGKVEIIVEGEAAAISNFIQWCHEGPPGARVDKVDITWEEYIGEFTSFSIQYLHGW
ncbi:MAG: acylphosphatase [bacterium]